MISFHIAELSVVEAAANEVCKAAEDVLSSELMGGLLYAFSFFKAAQQRAGWAKAQLRNGRGRI